MIKLGDQLGDQSPTMAHLSAGISHFSHMHGGRTLRLPNPHTIKGDTIKRKRSVVVRNGQGISQCLSQGLANPHPRSIVNGSIGARDVARPTVTGTPRDLPKPVLNPPQNPPPNPFSWSANPPVNSGGMLLAGEQPPPGAASPYTPPKLAVGAASDPGA